MRTKSNVLKISHVEYLGNYSLKFLFSDGKESTIDFKPFLSSAGHPEVKKYLNPKFFRNFSFEAGDFMWGDFDLIFPVADLYSGEIFQSKRKQTHLTTRKNQRTVTRVRRRA